MKHFILIISTFILFSSFLAENTRLPKPFNKQFQFIPSGLALVDGDTLSVQSFYMLDHEITNWEYKSFLTFIKEGNKAAYEEAKVRNKEWSKQLNKSFIGPMEELYHIHEAYLDYPVVNITHKAAELYCEYLEEKINKELLKSQKIKVRLPTRAEFIRAGVGNNFDWQYAWGNNKFTNSEGRFLCNFTRIPYSRMSRGENDELVLKDTKLEIDYVSEGTSFFSPKKSYYPNTYDIYNLNGNVAEWLGGNDNLAAGGSWRDYGYDVRLQSVKTYETASPMVGFRPVITIVKE